jgi:non-ribosomal peptide synthetase component E (peptide arylation enzyme)
VAAPPPCVFFSRSRRWSSKPRWLKALRHAHGIAGRPERLISGTEVRVIDDKVDRSSEEDIGELITRGPFNSPGHYGEPGLTAAAFKRDGWFYTGDLGRLDDAGYLHFEGSKQRPDQGRRRERHLRLRSRFFLMSYPAVKLAQVVPVPDRPVTDEISRVRITKYIRFVSARPMLTTKVRKADLRHQLISELGLI